MSVSQHEDAFDFVLAHYESPYHRGHLAKPTCVYAARNPVCGDQVQLELLIEDAHIAQAYFDAKGCTISQASASILCQAIEGKPWEQVAQMPAQQMLDLLRIRLTATRQQCGLLAFKALKTMVYSFDATRCGVVSRPRHLARPQVSKAENRRKGEKGDRFDFE